MGYVHVQLHGGFFWLQKTLFCPRLYICFIAEAHAEANLRTRHRFMMGTLSLQNVHSQTLIWTDSQDILTLHNDFVKVTRTL